MATAARSDALPEVPTLGDFVPEYEASDWFGLGAPRNTPAEVVDRLNQDINEAFGDSKTRAQLLGLGGDLLTGSAGEFRKLIAEET